MNSAGLTAGMNEELRMLRMRAYGASPDIEDDPAAMRRLVELEDLARAAASGADEPQPEPAPDTAPEPAPETAPAETAEQDATNASDAPDRDRDLGPAPRTTAARVPLTRRVRLVWAASLALTAVVAVCLTLLAISVAPGVREVDARQVATPAADESAAWPSFFGERAEGSIVFADFSGLTAIRQRGGGIGREGMDCLGIFQTESVQSGTDYYEGSSYFGCGSGVFPVRVPVLVDSSSPAELLDRFPLNSSLEFVWDGDTLVVYSDAGS